jgi:amidase
MSFPDYADYDGLGLAELVRAGQVSASELVDEAIRRIDAVNPQLNAVVHRMYERAREAAAGDLGDGPFAGVPFLLKDLIGACQGEPTSSGSRFCKDFYPSEDSELVRRFEAAGLVTLGKTNTPEFGILPVTEPELWGPTRNPWDTELTPGGSSGGSAAAVASGMVPIASGGDGGGSIRIPAACCGLFGLKPSRGRNPMGPDEVEGWAGCVVEHVITRSVRDSAAVLDATSGADPGSHHAAAAPERPFLNEVGAAPGRLRIAFSAVPGIPAEVGPDCLEAMESAAALCEELGHDLVEETPPVDAEAFEKAFMTMLAGEVAADVREAERSAGRRAGSGDIEPATGMLRLLGDAMPAGEYSAAVRELKRTSRTMSGFFEKYDMLLTPTTATPAPKIGSLLPSGIQLAALKGVVALRAGWLLRAAGVLEREAGATLAFTPFTMLFNASGNPAMSVPLHWNDDGLPIGAQFVAPLDDEASLFRLAAQLEEARPWRDRRPPVWAGAADDADAADEPVERADAVTAEAERA